MTWQGENFGHSLKALAGAVEPDRPALVHGTRVVSWSDLDRLSDAVAAGLIARGLKQGDAAGQMLRNSPDYMIAYFGCAKAGIIPVNVNYHYKERELADIFARFGLKALFVEPEFAERAAAAMPDGALAPIAVGGTEWEALLAHEPAADFAPCADPDALFYTATGGTTGMPKAVMWPFGAAWQAFAVPVWQRGPGVPPFVAQDLAAHVAEAARIGPEHPGSAAALLLLSPLMHGAGQFAAVIHLLKGGTLVTLPATSFNADLAIDTIRDRQVRSVSFVGDAFALPLAAALEARGDAAEAIASVRMITSSGAVFSESVKQRLLAVNPAMTIVDALGSSESAGTAIVITTAAGSSGGGRFSALPGRETKLFDADFNEVPPGSDGIGMVARSGPLPLGYLGEDERNARTFPVIGGKRWLMTGDQARWGADGTMAFIGRDNMCINTGGEKVFPEEVEAVLQAHPDVADVRVVGVPDPRFGRKVAAVVQGDGDGLEAALDAHARANLAGYKVPRLYVFTGESLRLNNGKPDYKRAQALAEAVAG
jgi:fatty-acyl-CoA synthase